MKLPDLAFGSEWALLELLCLGLESPDEREMFEELIRLPHLDWETLLTQAKRHKMLFSLAFYVHQDFAKLVPPFVEQQLRTALFFNRHKMAIYRREAAQIVRAFNQQGVRFVATKGISLESSIYGGKGIRYLSDIDLMIVPENREVVNQILSDLGYKLGTFDVNKGQIIPHSRQTLVGYKLNPDHLPSRVKLIDDPIIRFVEVDVANSLTWTFSPFQVPLDLALAEIVTQEIPGINDVQMPCFSPYFQFIFTVMHLFKEAWIIRLTLNDSGKDVSLSKFGDVVRLWRVYRQVLEGEKFVRMILDFAIIEPIVWVLEHLDRTLQTGIVSTLGLTGRVSEEWLSSASGKKWKGTMRDRLYSQNRPLLFLEKHLSKYCP